MVHLHNGILFDHKKEEKLTFCESMDGPGGIILSKAVRERQIP